MGLSKAEFEREKQSSSRQQRLQRLGRLSSEIEQERRETKDLVVGIEDVTASLGIQHRVSVF